MTMCFLYRENGSGTYFIHDIIELFPNAKDGDDFVRNSYEEKGLKS